MTPSEPPPPRSAHNVVRRLLWGALLVAILGGSLALPWGGWLARTAPQLELVGVQEGSVRGEIQLVVAAEDASPGLRSVAVFVDGEPVEGLSGERWTINTRALSDGVHSLTVEATDASWRRNRARVEATLRVDNTPPKLQLLSTAPGEQGRTFPVVVRVEEGELEEIELSFLGRDHSLYAMGDGLYRALLGVPIQQEPGVVELAVRAADRAGNQGSLEGEVELRPVDYPARGFIRLSSRQRAERKDKEAIALARAEREAAYAHDDDQQRWDGPLLRPAPGRVTSPFGRYRSYSDGRRSHHTGVDIANRRGAPVVSAAAGVVLVAGWQAIYGNVVIVHHGQGVSSSYNHLDAVSVQVGELVEAGQELGRLGNTGQSTGAHLHWGLVVGGVAVDPTQWLEQGFGLEELGG